MLEGAVCVHIDAKTVRLRDGDCLDFDVMRAVTFENETKQDARYVIITRRGSIVRKNVMSLIVRDATLEDAEDILAIYNFAAINTTAVWTDGPADLGLAARMWIARTARGRLSRAGRDERQGCRRLRVLRRFPALRPGYRHRWRIRSMSAQQHHQGSASAAA